MENKKFIDFLTKYSNNDNLSKNDYENILKEIDKDFNDNNINNFSNYELTSNFKLMDIDKTKESTNINDVLKYGNTGNILLDSKKNEIQRLVSEYNYIKQYNKEIKTDNDNNIKKLRKVNIKCTINNIQDLINIINENEYNHNTEYNINLESLHKIKDDLIKLNNMIGLNKLKETILDQLLYFLQGLHVVDNKNNDYKHMVLYGPPGTGKTEIAKIIGSIYSKIGLLSKTTFKKACRSDLIGGYLGQTAIKTDKLIKECLGGVLFIDEAYSLASEDTGDSYSKECLDTLNECLSNYKDDLIVIIAGYEKALENTIFKTNIGLKSRFVWKFEMDAYNHEELYKIFLFMIKNINWTIDKNIKKDWFLDKYNNFESYGRDVETLLTNIKIAHGRRLYGSDSKHKEITKVDMDNGYKRYIDNKKKDNKNEFLNTIYV
tara:strand:- start:465 stop:1763 length:1299 start_codon:yes stop_codon:yes gene_type:complete